MAYVNQEKKAKIAAELKKVIPQGWKYSLAVRHHSTIVLTISAAPVNLLAECKYDRAANATYLDINHFYLENAFEGELLALFEKIKDALNTDNYDKSDLQTDYFNVGHYIDLNVGRWNKPFQHITK